MTEPIDSSIITAVISFLMKNDKDVDEKNVFLALESMKLSDEQKNQEFCKMICEQVKTPIRYIRNYNEGLHSVS
jgi:hypothetical protein